MDRECWKKRNFRDHGYVSKRTIHQKWKIKRKKVTTVQYDNDDIQARGNKEDLNAAVDIWKYSFHPRSSKAVDWNFLPIPESVVQTLQEFCFDVCEAFLPDELLTGDIDSTSSFMEKLPLITPEKEVFRRRSIRQSVLKMTNNSIWQAMRTIRNYHFNKVTETLVTCSDRSDCITHLRWDHLKAFRENARSQDLPTDDYSPEDVYEFSAKMPTTPRRDNRKRLHATNSL